MTNEINTKCVWSVRLYSYDLTTIQAIRVKFHTTDMYVYYIVLKFNMTGLGFRLPFTWNIEKQVFSPFYHTIELLKNI